MTYIYIIHNDINDKKYVGKTKHSLKRRFSEHLVDSRKHRKQHRPLYNAINKYGKEHFWIEEIEECLHEEASDRERYWIQFYKSNEQGYNLTLGGDGRMYLDYNKILTFYDNTDKSQKEIAEICNCSVDSVSNIVEQYRENVDWIERANKKRGNMVRCVENGLIFKSISEAANWLMETKNMSKDCYTHIGQVCNGKRKTVGKYHWEYVDENLKKIAKEQSNVEKSKVPQNKPVRCIETNIVYKSQKEASRQTGIHKSSISDCCKGKRRTAGGYHWEYVKNNEE